MRAELDARGEGGRDVRDASTENPAAKEREREKEEEVWEKDANKKLVGGRGGKGAWISIALFTQGWVAIDKIAGRKLILDGVPFL